MYKIIRLSVLLLLIFASGCGTIHHLRWDGTATTGLDWRLMKR
jgi:hypothetical protein